MSLYDTDCEMGCKLLKTERDKLKAIKTPLDGWITNDGTLENIISIVEKILEVEG